MSNEPGQRQFQRADMSISMRFRPYRSLAELWRPGVILDLSAGGFRFSSEEILEEQTDLEFQVYLPIRKDPYRFDGKVMWMKPGAEGETVYGVSILRLTDMQQVELDRLVEFLNQGPSGPGPSSR